MVRGTGRENPDRHLLFISSGVQIPVRENVWLNELYDGGKGEFCICQL